MNHAYKLDVRAARVAVAVDKELRGGDIVDPRSGARRTPLADHTLYGAARNQKLLERTSVKLVEQVAAVDTGERPVHVAALGGAQRAETSHDALDNLAHQIVGYRHGAAHDGLVAFGDDPAVRGQAGVAPLVPVGVAFHALTACAQRGTLGPCAACGFKYTLFCAVVFDES